MRPRPVLRFCSIFPSIASLLLTGGVLRLSLSGARQQPVAKADPSVVAVGDVHGDFDGFCLILRQIGLIDEQRHWRGGKATLVQTGDLIDRGPKGRDAMDFLMSLETEAAESGGQVVPLLGNHEVMNLIGDLRYVSSQDYARYADADSQKRRQAAYDDYSSWLTSHAGVLSALQRPVFPASELEWMEKHPPGFVERAEAFGPAGVYGRWIRNHAAIAKINGVLFLHGGLAPPVASMKLEEINSQVRQEIADYDATKQELVSRRVILPFFTLQEVARVLQVQSQAKRPAEKAVDASLNAKIARLLEFGNWLSMREDGPLWFRGYDSMGEEDGAALAETILAAYDAKHIVVGHTVQSDGRIHSRFAGRVFLIDTGMLSTYFRGGRASALEFFSDGRSVAAYPDSEQVLFEEKRHSEMR